MKNASDAAARHVAIGELIYQGHSREWAEEHLIEASWGEDGQVHYSVELDKPVEFVFQKFEVSNLPND
jgi:hypothetical protein